MSTPLDLKIRKEAWRTANPFDTIYGNFSIDCNFLFALHFKGNSFSKLGIIH